MKSCVLREQYWCVLRVPLIHLSVAMLSSSCANCKSVQRVYHNRVFMFALSTCHNSYSSSSAYTLDHTRGCLSPAKSRTGHSLRVTLSLSAHLHADEIVIRW
jgi:hypothetical protein